ncbi:L,D-transpeptidase family protein [Microbulbifer thermotolerans]|uniref:L,D-transpeptidase family protein n=1 Tax=Microbulbifer thermotolerans TaxID=252514 RepID=UPI0008DF1E90|nr:L,D-transpeptidase family protein [Microbulbifer thermotolerans]MCX2831300.1 L,D-transpeptidase family protein [Microbulbifer thermotolerans]SFD02830.1 Murein L,D-transpeptidase YcbB/YkuD [Microbulbifer thermotolerans]
MSYFTPKRRTRKSLLPLLTLGSLCVFALYYAFAANQQTEPVLPDNAVRPHLVLWLEENPDAWPAQDPIFNPAAVRRIYRRTDYRLLWFDNYNLSDTANDLLKQLTAASSGNPSSMVDYRYHLGYFDRTLRDTPQRLQMAAVLDVLLTDAFVSYARDTQLDKLTPKSRPPKGVTPVYHQAGGFQLAQLNTSRQNNATDSGYRTVSDVSPPGNYARDRSRERYYYNRGRGITRFRHYSTWGSRSYSTRNYSASARNYPYQESRQEAGNLATSEPLSGNSEGPYIEENTPYGGDVAALRNELARLRGLSASGRWRPLPPGPAMTLGARHPHVALLRNMLALYGDYYSYGGEPNSDRFDQRLHEAVLRFQERHGLKPDGIVGRETRKRLNLSPAARAQIVEINIRRREQLPAHLGNRFVQVNVPEYKLHYVEDDRIRLSMNVVVGKKKHATPEMTTRVSKVIFNPTWTVPRSILVNEILPKARANPTGMENMGYRVVSGSGEYLPLTPKNLSAAGAGSYLLRQKGGEDNILGRVKFEIPNRHDIYLHDTRARSLFAKTDRDYSHGCIRLEKPRHLAEALLRPEGNWDQWRIDQLTTGDETTEVELKQRVPVYITYWTAWVDGRGHLNFRDDIYGKDGLSANQW